MYKDIVHTSSLVQMDLTKTIFPPKYNEILIDDVPKIYKIANYYSEKNYPRKNEYLIWGHQLNYTFCEPNCGAFFVSHMLYL